MSISKKIHNTKLIKWTALFKEQSESGLKVKDWCLENGISKDSYYYWKRKVKEALLDSSAPEIVPISTSAPASSINPDMPLDSYNHLPQNDSCGLFNLYNTRDISDSIHISSRDIQEISSSASTKLISKIIEVIRNA